MKKYFNLIFDFHKKNIKFYIFLISIIYIRYWLKIPTPLRLLSKSIHIKYWSSGLTTASIQILKLNFKRAYQCNPLIYLVMIVVFFHIFIEPIIKKNKNFNF